MAMHIVVELEDETVYKIQPPACEPSYFFGAFLVMADVALGWDITAQSMPELLSNKQVWNEWFGPQPPSLDNAEVKQASRDAWSLLAKQGPGNLTLPLARWAYADPVTQQGLKLKDWAWQETRGVVLTCIKLKSLIQAVSELNLLDTSYPALVWAPYHSKSNLDCLREIALDAGERRLRILLRL